jgi:hypothetical protein
MLARSLAGVSRQELAAAAFPPVGWKTAPEGSIPVGRHQSGKVSALGSIRT